VKRVPLLSSVTVLAALLGLGQMVGCGEETDSSSSAQHLSQAQRAAKKKAIAACHLDDGTVDPDDTDLRACEPGNTKKTTICHVPPGNPANAHTLCIGNPAVPHHLANHPDYLGPCKAEIACPPSGPPPGPPSGGGMDTGGAPGTGGAPATGGAPGTGGDSGGGQGGAGGLIP
jgi:hypothetical protein